MSACEAPAFAEAADAALTFPSRVFGSRTDVERTATLEFEGIVLTARLIAEDFRERRDGGR